MSILVISGPPASGKNTVAQYVGRGRHRCVVVRADLLAQMIVSPSLDSTDSGELATRQAFGLRNACGAARAASEGNYDIVLVDTLDEVKLSAYRSELSSYDLFVVMLMPTKEEIISRVLSRPDYLSEGELDTLYEQQQGFDGYDEQLDNTSMSPEQAAEWVLSRWPHKTGN